MCPVGWGPWTGKLGTSKATKQILVPGSRSPTHTSCLPLLRASEREGTGVQAGVFLTPAGVRQATEGLLAPLSVPNVGSGVALSADEERGCQRRGQGWARFVSSSSQETQGN